MNVKNCMEELVWSHLNRVLESYPENLCRCQRCQNDLAALALNFLPPRYVATDRGEIFTKIRGLEAQFTVDVISAISMAAVIVSKNPRHEASPPKE